MNRRQRRKHLKTACLAYYIRAAVEILRSGQEPEPWAEFWAKQPHRPREPAVRIPHRRNQRLLLLPESVAKGITSHG